MLPATNSRIAGMTELVDVVVDHILHKYYIPVGDNAVVMAVVVAVSVEDNHVTVDIHTEVVAVGAAVVVDIHTAVAEEDNCAVVDIHIAVDIHTVVVVDMEIDIRMVAVNNLGRDSLAGDS